MFTLKIFSFYLSLGYIYVFFAADFKIYLTVAITLMIKRDFEKDKIKFSETNTTTLPLLNPLLLLNLQLLVAKFHWYYYTVKPHPDQPLKVNLEIPALLKVTLIGNSLTVRFLCDVTISVDL